MRNKGLGPLTATRDLLLGTLVLVVLGGVVLISTWLERREVGPTFARYSFAAEEGDAYARGVLEVDTEEGSLCLDLTSRGIQASHLVERVPTSVGGRTRPDVNAIVVEFFDPTMDDAQGRANGSHCFRENDIELEALITHPSAFAIDFHRGPNDSPGLVAELKVGD